MHGRCHPAGGHYHQQIYLSSSLLPSISFSTIKDWFKAVVGKIKPIYDLLRAHVLVCWAHARRKFFEARNENEKLANEALFYIGKPMRWTRLTASRTTNAERPCDRRNLIPKKLSLYITDGRYRMDNNLVETVSGHWPSAGRTICSVAMTMLHKGPPWSIPCSPPAKPTALTKGPVLRRMPEYELGKKDFSGLLPGNWSAAGVE